MKKLLLFIPYFLLAGGLWVVNSCHFGSSSNEDPISTDLITVARGQKSFLDHCSSCHNFRNHGIGPQLGGITSEATVSWVKNFIHDPKKIIESGDERAQKLFKKYKVIMPSFGHLPDDEINAIIAFMHTQKKQVRKLMKADPNDIRNPIADSIETSDLVVGVELLTKIPPSADQPPLTRIIKLDFQPATGDLFISDLRGKLYKFVGGHPSVYLDMAALKPKLVTAPGINTGFGSFAFHPEFATNGLLYTTHAEPAFSGKADFNYADSIPVTLQWILSEWKTDPKGFPFSGKSREIFRVNMPTSVHGVQEIAFNRYAKRGDEDYGLLYIGIGDGGSAINGYPLVSPAPEKVWGSILRIDPLGSNSTNKQYGIPPNNPFSKKEPEKYAPEIYAYGFRNPHRFNWTKSGQFLAVNIGEHHIESVNMILPGHYYGWPIREGKFEERFFNETGKIYPLPRNDSIYHVTYPVAQYDHDEGAAISGGFEYTGTATPQLAGKYVFGDIVTGKLFYVETKDLAFGKQATVKKWNISMNGVLTTLADLSRSRRVELRFGVDQKGEIYILTKPDGKVYKLVNR